MFITTFVHIWLKSSSEIFFFPSDPLPLPIVPPWFFFFYQRFFLLSLFLTRPLFG